MLVAAQKFDPDRGVKFISYAVWWIRQAIQSEIASHSRAIRLPTNRAAEVARLSRIESALRQAEGREPTEQHLAAKLKISVQDVGLLKQYAVPCLSLDAPTSADDERSWLDKVSTSDPVEVNGCGEAKQRALQEVFRKYLTEREQKILVFSYGLDGGAAMSYAEVGSLLGVCHERIRQIHNRAVRKMRTCKLSIDLEAHLAPFKGPSKHQSKPSK